MEQQKVHTTKVLSYGIGDFLSTVQKHTID